MNFMLFRAHKQVEEALSETNRYFCSKAMGHLVDDPEQLIRYFCKNGGAADFDRRFREAFSEENRYYCSKFYGFCVEDEQMIWDYYTERSISVPFDNSLENSNRS
jgi:hypothetical protein